MFGENGDGCSVCGVLGILGVLADGSYALMRHRRDSVLILSLGVEPQILS